MDNKIIENIVNNYGTPIYIYDMDIIAMQLNSLKCMIPDGAKIFYSMKANPLVGICQIMKNNGCGVEVASKGEMYIALQAGFSPEEIIFTSPGKTSEELNYATYNNVKLINIETLEEAKLINQEAEKRNVIMNIALRINPSVINAKAGLQMSGISSQFGIEEEQLNNYFFSEIRKLNNISLNGIQVYMGTQILVAEDIVRNTEYAIRLALKLSKDHKFKLKYLNMGGGFGVPYFLYETKLDIITLQEEFKKLFQKYSNRLLKTELIFESGRYIIAEAGIFVTKILYCKESKGTKFLICDGGSNFHSSSAFLGRYVRNNFPMYVMNNEREIEQVNVTGPLCTPTDLIGQKVKLNKAFAGDILVIEKSGAYGLTQSPLNFLSHETPAEILVNGNSYYLLRKRGKMEELLIGQNILSLEDIMIQNSQ